MLKTHNKLLHKITIRAISLINYEKTYILILSIITIGCASQKTKELKNKYEISNSVTFQLNQTETINVNELRFKPKHGPSDLQKFLFKKYGKWNNTIQSDRKINFLVWNNLKLLETSDELFTVAAGGDDKKFELIKINNIQKYGQILYCSAIVFTSKNKDCFQSSYELKDSIAEFLINGTKSIKKKDALFKKN